MKQLTTVLLALLLSSCGFQLRGNYQLDPALQRVHLMGGNTSALVVELRRSLRRADVELVASPETATAVLKILEHVNLRRILSIRSDAKVGEYELISSFKFQIDGVGTHTSFKIPATRLSVTRDFLFDENAILSKEEEEARLRSEMNKDLVHQVMDSLASDI